MRLGGSHAKRGTRHLAGASVTFALTSRESWWFNRGEIQEVENAFLHLIADFYMKCEDRLSWNSCKMRLSSEKLKKYVSSIFFYLSCYVFFLDIYNFIDFLDVFNRVAKIRSIKVFLLLLIIKQQANCKCSISEFASVSVYPHKRFLMPRNFFLILHQSSVFLDAKLFYF